MKCSVVGKVHGVSYCETSKRYNVRISGGKKNGSRNHGSHTTEAEAALAYNFLVLNRPPEDSLSQLLCRSMLSPRGASLHRSPDLQVLKLPKKDQRTKTLNVFATGTEDDEAENRLCGSLHIAARHLYKHHNYPCRPDERDHRQQKQSIKAGR